MRRLPACEHRILSTGVSVQIRMHYAFMNCMVEETLYAEPKLDVCVAFFCLAEHSINVGADPRFKSHEPGAAIYTPLSMFRYSRSS